MKREIKILLAFVVVIAILLLSFYLAFKESGNSKKQIVPSQVENQEDVLNNLMTDEQKIDLNLSQDKLYEITSRDVKGNIATYRELPIAESVVVDLDFMTDEEIKEKYLSLEGKYQVLERDEEGNVLSYRIINSDEDILETFNQYSYKK